MRGLEGATLLLNSPCWGVADSGFMDMLVFVCGEEDLNDVVVKDYTGSRVFWVGIRVYSRRDGTM